MRRAASLCVERLEERENPATVDLSGGILSFTDSGSENNNLTVGVAAGVYSFNDSASIITLTQAALDAGCKGSGTNTVSGPASAVDGIEVYAGGGTNTVNVRSIIAPTTIYGQSGITTVYACAATPSMIGNMDQIQAPLNIVAGHATNLWASDYSGQSRPDPVTVSASGITGLSPFAINITGTLNSLRVTGSNGAFAESYEINGVPCKSFNLYTQGGNDTVNVNANVTGSFYLGSGDDLLTVLAGVTITGNVDTGLGFDTVYYGAPEYGSITGKVI